VIIWWYRIVLVVSCIFSGIGLCFTSLDIYLDHNWIFWHHWRVDILFWCVVVRFIHWIFKHISIAR
jgi:hypothetical protein